MDASSPGDPEAMIRVFAETTVTLLVLDDDGRIARAFVYVRVTGPFVAFVAPAVVLATGDIGKTYKITSNSGPNPHEPAVAHAAGGMRFIY